MRKHEELTNPNSCTSRAKDDEMLFVLLGRDKAAVATVRFWIDERIRLGKTNQKIRRLWKLSGGLQQSKKNNLKRTGLREVSEN